MPFETGRRKRLRINMASSEISNKADDCSAHLSKGNPEILYLPVTMKKIWADQASRAKMTRSDEIK